MNIIINCPICGSEIILDPQIHILDDVVRTEYCEFCEEIIEVVNQQVLRT